MANVDTNKLKQLLMAMIDTLDEADSNEDSSVQQSDVVQSSQKPQKTNNRNNRNKRKPYASGENLFLNMQEKDMHKNDVEIDKKLAPKQLTSRNRPSTMIEVRCRVCGKEESVSSQLITDGAGRYKCNNCSRGSG